MTDVQRMLIPSYCASHCHIGVISIMVIVPVMGCTSVAFI